MLLDQLLGWAVIAIPFLLSVLFIFIPAKTEDPSRHMKWRLGLVVTGFIFSLLAWWQQSRALHASARDRDEAIKQTASQTSQQVTKDVTERDAQMLGTCCLCLWNRSAITNTENASFIWTGAWRWKPPITACRRDGSDGR